MLNTKPPGGRTGYSNPQCYAHPLGDCIEEITREHYISKKLLERIATGEITAKGLAWRDGPGPVSAKSLRAWVLCKRHNEALSSLDSMITDLYDAIIRWHDGKPVGQWALDGEDIERWAIKVMIGLLASGGAAIGQQRVDARGVPDSYLRILFGESEIPEGAGMYCIEGRPDLKHGDVDNAKLGLWVHYENFEPIGGKPQGIGISMLGFTFVTMVLDPIWYPAYRPQEIAIGDGALTLRWGRRPPKALRVQLAKDDV